MRKAEIQTGSKGEGGREREGGGGKAHRCHRCPSHAAGLSPPVARAREKASTSALSPLCNAHSPVCKNTCPLEERNTAHLDVAEDAPHKGQRAQVAHRATHGAQACSQRGSVQSRTSLRGRCWKKHVPRAHCYAPAPPYRPLQRRLPPLPPLVACTQDQPAHPGRT